MQQSGKLAFLYSYRNWEQFESFNLSPGQVFLPCGMGLKLGTAFVGSDDGSGSFGKLGLKIYQPLPSLSPFPFGTLVGLIGPVHKSKLQSYFNCRF
jgi:hypothetical protein